MSEIQFNPELRDSLVHIVEASVDDAIKIAALRKTTWLDTYTSEEDNITMEDLETVDFESEKKLEKLRLQIKESVGSNTILIAKEGEEIVAWCRTIQHPRHEIMALSVSPENQGKGIGKELMEKALALLGDNENIYVEVVEYNKKAIEFYKKLGFTISNEPTPVNTKVNGKPLYCITMVKSGYNGNKKSIPII